MSAARWPSSAWGPFCWVGHGRSNTGARRRSRGVTFGVRAPRSDAELRPEVDERLAQPLLERHLGLPAQDLPGACDVGLADLRIVHGQGLLHDPAPRTRETDDLLGELPDRHLVGVADVDRVHLVRL